MGTMQWAPRLLGVAVSLFLGIFALDSVGTTSNEINPDLLMHLVPTAVLLGVVALSWRREWIGAAAFIALAIAYAVMARDHLSWVAVISGPLVVTGALYAASWTRRARLATR